MLIERYMTRDKIFVKETSPSNVENIAVGRKYATFMLIASHTFNA